MKVFGERRVEGDVNPRFYGNDIPFHQPDMSAIIQDRYECEKRTVHFCRLWGNRVDRYLSDG